MASVPLPAAPPEQEIYSVTGARSRFCTPNQYRVLLRILYETRGLDLKGSQNDGLYPNIMGTWAAVWGTLGVQGRLMQSRAHGCKCFSQAIGKSQTQISL